MKRAWKKKEMRVISKHSVIIGKKKNTCFVLKSVVILMKYERERERERERE